MKKTIIFTLLGFVIGLALGYIATMAFTGYKIASAMFMLQEKEIIQMEEVAVQAYYNEPNEVAVWALENHIKTLNRLKEERSSSDVENPYFILFPAQSLVCSQAREDSGNVAHGGTVNPPRNRKGGAGNPPPKSACAPELYPD